MALGLDGVRIEGCKFRRLEGLQDVFIARHDQTMGGQLEGIDLLVSRAVLLDHLARRVGGAGTRQLDLHIRIFLLEAFEQRPDLCAGRIDED